MEMPVAPESQLVQMRISELFGFYSYIVPVQKLPLPRSPSAILPRVALLVFFASAFHGCFRVGFSAEFRDLLPRRNASAELPRPSAHTGKPRVRTKI